MTLINSTKKLTIVVNLQNSFRLMNILTFKRHALYNTKVTFLYYLYSSNITKTSIKRILPISLYSASTNTAGRKRGKLIKPANGYLGGDKELFDFFPYYLV